MEPTIRVADAMPPGEQPVEVVERKGLGHPDTICDAIAEQICVRLCRYYRDRFGAILHHNVDKVLLVGGAARPALGGGAIVAPIELYLAGRATAEYRGERIPVADLAVEACRSWLRAHLPLLDLDRHVVIVPRIGPGSGDLASLFVRGGSAMPLANDTSCGAGFAPLTDLERVVLAVEQALTASDTRACYTALGADVKVMGIRRGRRIALTIGCAMVGRELAGLDDYIAARRTAVRVAVEAARRATRLAVEAVVNAADDIDRGEIFLTVTGTSAEAGDDGEVGRGNRTSGLITPYRPMTLEAAAGKNPVSHVGKLYNVAAGAIAAAIVREIPGVHDVTCVLVSQIGRPIDDPQIADVRVALEAGRGIDDIGAKVVALIRDQMTRLPELRDALVAERIRVF